LEDCVDSNGETLEFVFIDREKYHVFQWKERFSVETYFRLEIQDVLPKDIDRVLYLDIDMIVNKDISDLYELDFEDNYIAACGFSPNCERGDEFNAGMILFNMDKMRRDISFETYVALAQKLDGNFYQDQGLLNAQFGENGTKYLPKQMYNFTCAFYRKYKKELEPDFRLEDAVIIHFPGPGIRPWQARWEANDRKMLGRNNLQDVAASDGYLLDEVYYTLQEKWWRAAEKTTCYEQLLNEMYRKKCEIITSILDKTMETREYRYGYRILKILRKFKRR
jgi:lipopolysaccharide biosynthesis glycosyltransferase